MALNVATNVYGGRMTSSPGPMFRAPSEVSNAVVPEDVARQYFALMRWAKRASNSFTRAPPLPVRPHLPECRASIRAVSSRLSHFGQSPEPLEADDAAVLADRAGF